MHTPPRAYTPTSADQADRVDPGSNACAAPATSFLDQMLCLAEVEARVGLKKSAIYQGCKAGTFPAPVKLGRLTRWRLSAIAEWVANPSLPTRTDCETR